MVLVEADTQAAAGLAGVAGNPWACDSPALDAASDTTHVDADAAPHVQNAEMMHTKTVTTTATGRLELVGNGVTVSLASIHEIRAA